MSTPTELERASRAALLAELELLKAQAAKRQREGAAQHMSSEQWQLVYGAPIPGMSRPIGEVVAEQQLAVRGRVWDRRPSEPALGFGPEPEGWR